MSNIELVEEMMSSQFNASIQVTELLMKTLENVAKDLASRCISDIASRHGFDAQEEIKLLGLENLALIRKQMAKKSVSKAPKEPKEKKPKEKKVAFPMPFIAECVDLAGCQGLAYNRGLFTQCSKKSMENGSFCKGCQTEADKNATGCPDCGTVNTRLATGLYEFKDPKGRSPISYLKVLEKLKLTTEQALDEAGKLNIEIPEDHFVVIEKVKKSSASRGRPKKTGAVQADGVKDLFAKLSADGDDDEVVEDGEDKPVKAKKAKLSDEEKAAKKAALEAERAQKKAEREAKAAEEKAEKEAKRKAEAEIKKQEREAKLALEKAEREAKRAAEKAEREAKKAAEKAEKEAAKANKSKKSVAKEETKVEAAPAPVVVTAPVPAPAPAPAPTGAKVSVSRIQISGVAYLKSSTNILYNPQTKEEVGLWDPETKTIKPLPDDDESEVEEDGYESD